MLDNKNTLIACDLNGVVITSQSQAYQQWLDDHPEFVRLLPYLPHEGEPEDLFKRVLAQNPHLTSTVVECMQTFTQAAQVKHTCTIIKQLIKESYTVIPASNVSKTAYLAMIDNGTIPYFNKEQYFVLTHPLNKREDGTFYKKPSVEYFYNLKRYVKAEWPTVEHILFIDDQEPNTISAQQVGLIAIHFKTPKQLKQELSLLGINF